MAECGCSRPCNIIHVAQKETLQKRPSESGRQRAAVQQKQSKDIPHETKQLERPNSSSGAENSEPTFSPSRPSHGPWAVAMSPAASPLAPWLVLCDVRNGGFGGLSFPAIQGSFVGLLLGVQMSRETS